MPEIIKIVGDSVQYIREEVIREVGVDSFVANIEKNMGRDTGILPRGCLYMKTEGGKCVYLIEVQAGLVPVTYKDGRGNRSNLMISIPFTQFYLSCNYGSETILNAHLTVTKTPLVDINQEVFIAPYLNIFSNGEGEVCTGSMSVPQNVSLKLKVEAFVSGFFEADFNADLTPTTFAPVGVFENAQKYLKKWAEFTSKDRFFSCSKDAVYYKHPKTPMQIIEEGLK